MINDLRLSPITAERLKYIKYHGLEPWGLAVTCNELEIDRQHSLEAMAEMKSIIDSMPNGQSADLRKIMAKVILFDTLKTLNWPIMFNTEHKDLIPF